MVKRKLGLVSWREFRLVMVSYGDVYGVGRYKQGGKCWCYDDYRLRKVMSELKRPWGSLKKA